jgi:uncharacterized protein (TIGR03435 family)
LHAASARGVKTRMMRAFTSASLGILFSAAAFGQAGIRFEVASVKPVLNWPAAGSGAGERGTGGGCPTSMKVDPGRVDFKCTTIAMLIGYAFRFSPERVRGPVWMMAAGSPRFDIVAKIPQGASKHQVPEMFQALLAERFKLAIHRGTANLPVYALVVAKGGLKVKEAAPEADAQIPSADPDAPASLDEFYGNIQSRTIPNADGSGSITMIGNPRMGTVRQTGDPLRVQRWEASSISFAGLADLLDHVAPLPSPVIDMTGLKGRYRLVLEVSLRDLPGERRRISGAGGEPPAADNPVADMGETIMKGFNDGLLKLGLRLELRKGPLEILVVDRVEKTPTEN